LPGRTPKEAQDAYLGPIRESLSCIVDLSVNHLVTSASSRLASSLQLHFRNAVAPLRGTDLALYFEQTFHPAQDESGLFKITTDAYNYRVDRKTGRGQKEEVVSYHWHPHTTEDVQFPHLHIHVTDHSHVNRVHFPTGRMSIERLIQFLVRDYNVTRRRTDWDEVISRNMETFERHRTWHS
jgi:hypothetical protein